MVAPTQVDIACYVHQSLSINEAGRLLASAAVSAESDLVQQKATAIDHYRAPGGTGIVGVPAFLVKHFRTQRKFHVRSWSTICGAAA